MLRTLLKEHATLVDYLSRLTDPLLALLCIQGLGNSFHVLHPPMFVKVLSILLPILVLFIFPLFDLYKSWRGMPIRTELRQLFLGWITTLLCFHVITLLLADQKQFAILWPFGIFRVKGVLFTAGLTFIVLAIYRVVLRTALRYARSRGYNVRRVIIVGAGELGKRLAGTILDNPWLGYSIVGFFDDDSEKQNLVIYGVPVEGSLDCIPEYLQRQSADVIFLALPLRAETRITQVMQHLDDFTGDVIMVPDIFNYYLLNCSMSEIAGLPVINLRGAPHGMATYCKRLGDYAISIVALALFAIPMLVIALAVKLSSPGPVIFRQRRYGLNGREIVVYKFRTMTVCEDGQEVVQAKKCDPRVTQVGAFLRKYNLDELPQFFNVLQGRLSVVGPRPHAVAHNEYYRKRVQYYMLRHKFKPGITGWAQVNGWRGETDNIEKMQMRVKYDLEYIDNWSLWFDIKILFLTVVRVFNQGTAY